MNARGIAVAASGGSNLVPPFPAHGALGSNRRQIWKTSLGVTISSMLPPTQIVPRYAQVLDREEQKDIDRRLQELKSHVTRTYSLSEPEMEILNEKIDYVVDAAARLGRIDWRNAVVGAILGYIITAGLPPESARSIIQILSALLQALSHYFGHRLPELPSL
jgi:hypothetical protein